MTGRRLVALLGLTAAIALGGAPAASAGGRPAVPGVKKVVALQTKERGGGAHPTLRWKPVRDAAEYLVVVQSTKGRPYWTWRGDATQVRLGGDGPDPKRRSEGASLTTARTWFVIGLAANGDVVAASVKRPISP